VYLEFDAQIGKFVTQPPGVWQQELNAYALFARMAD